MSTYLPNGTGNTAFDWGGGSFPTTAGSLSQTGETELTSGELNAISDDDSGTNYDFDKVTGIGGVRIEYDITETNVDSIDVTGKVDIGGSTPQTVNQHAWNGSSWDQISTDSTSASLFTATANISDTYVVGGKVHIALEVNSPSVNVSTIYHSQIDVTEAAAAPTVSSVTPSEGEQGATGLDLTVAGTDFVDGATTSFSGTGITVNSTTFVSSTELTVNIDIAAGATASARDVTVTNPDAQEDTLVGGFTVTEAAAGGGSRKTHIGVTLSM